MVRTAKNHGLPFTEKGVFMYERIYNIPAPTNNDFYRVREIKFYLLCYNLMSYYKEPVTIIELLDTLAKLFDCNHLHISQLVLNCYKKDPAFVPTQFEVHALLAKTNLSIRKIADITKSANKTIYADLQRFVKDPFEGRPRLNTAQSETLAKFMAAVETLSKIFKVW